MGLLGSVVGTFRLPGRTRLMMTRMGRRSFGTLRCTRGFSVPCARQRQSGGRRQECTASKDSHTLTILAMVEPLAVGWHAVNISPWKPGMSALVLGGGPIGLSVIQALRARGEGQIIVSELSAKRKEFAKQFGADVIIDPTKEDVVKRCRELCENQGVNVVYDCAGVQAGLDTAVEAVRARGAIVNIAIWEKPCTITPNQFCFKERSYHGVATYQAGDFQAVLDAISSGRMKPEGMITKKIKLDEVVEEGFTALIKDKENQVKILVASGKGV